MTTVIYITLFFYMLSSSGYIAYFLVQKDKFYKSSYYILLTGFLFHSIIIAYGCIKQDHFFLYNFSDTLLFIGWALAFIFIVLRFKFNIKILGAFVVPIITVIFLFMTQIPREAVIVNNTLNNLFLIFHVITVLTGEASFVLACGIGIIYILQENVIKNKKHGFFLRRLPSLDLLDSAGYMCIITGFILLTIGLISGFISAKIVWNKFITWDIKEVWSFITWLIYATLLHERATSGWRGRKAAIMSIIGCAVMLFTFLGINFLLNGHHGEFTKL